MSNTPPPNPTQTLGTGHAWVARIREEQLEEHICIRLCCGMTSAARKNVRSKRNKNGKNRKAGLQVAKTPFFSEHTLETGTKVTLFSSIHSDISFPNHLHSVMPINQNSRIHHSAGSVFVLSTKSTGIIAAISVGIAAAARPYGAQMSGPSLLLSLGALRCCWLGGNMVWFRHFVAKLS